MKLDLSHKNLTTLEGYTFPDGLTKLNVSFNELTSLPPLPLTLTVLSCTYNQLTSLPPLPGSLKELYCCVNQLDSLPLLPPTLTRLYCSHNRLTNLPPLPQSLTNLICGDNRFSSNYYNGVNRRCIESLRLIIRVDRLRKAHTILSQLVGDAAARNIQRVWRRYWMEPYHDSQLGHPVSRYLLHYKDVL